MRLITIIALIKHKMVVTLTRTSRKRKEKEGKLHKGWGPKAPYKSWRDWPEGFPDLK